MARASKTESEGGAAVAELEAPVVAPVETKPEALKPIEAGKYLRIPLDEIRPNPLNERKYFDPDYIKELSTSIKTIGLIEAIAVRELDTPEKGVKYEIISGECRYRAHKLLKAVDIQTVVKSVADIQRHIASLVTNVQRKDLSAVEESDGYQKLILTGQFTIPGTNTPDTQRLAEQIGKSRSYVYQRLQLQKLMPDIRALVGEGKIPASHAIEIARLGEEAQIKATVFTLGYKNSSPVIKSIAELKARMAEHLEDEPVLFAPAPDAEPFRSLMRYIEYDIQVALKDAAFNTSDADLVPACGACTTCPMRSGFELGKAQIDSKEQCYSPACFKQKTLAHEKAEKAKAKEKTGEAPIKLSKSYDYKTQEDTLFTNTEEGRQKLVPAKASDEDAIPAWDSDKKKVLYVKPKGKPVKAEQREDMDYEAQQKLREEMEQLNRAECLEIAKLLAGCSAERSDLESLAAHLITSNVRGFSTDVMKVFLDKEKIPYTGEKWNFRVNLEKLTKVQVEHVIMYAHWASEATEHNPKDFREIAKAHKIDGKACLERAKEQIAGMSKPTEAKPDEKKDTPAKAEKTKPAKKAAPAKKAPAKAKAKKKK